MYIHTFIHSSHIQHPTKTGKINDDELTNKRGFTSVIRPRQQ